MAVAMIGSMGVPSVSSVYGAVDTFSDDNIDAVRQRMCLLLNVILIRFLKIYLNKFNEVCSFSSVGSSFHNFGVLYFKHLSPCPVCINPMEMHIILVSSVYTDSFLLK